MRFYQTLAAGRIPILIDTDIKLPFEDKIDWKNFIILEKIAQLCLYKTIEIHKTGRYLEMQKMCSEVFKNYISGDNCFYYIVQQIRENAMLKLEVIDTKPNLFYWKIKKILLNLKQ